MSKKKINTREIILTKALEMFNERGVEYVGLRELAVTLNIRVSNITYYFPTKDDLVNQLALELNKSNSALMIDEKKLTMQSFMRTIQKVFRNQVRYRCIMLSIVHLMEHNKVISERHKQTQKDRSEVLETNINTLVANGFLKVEDEGQVEILAATIALIARFWISEATISYRCLSTEEQISYNLRLIANLLAPYVTDEGRKALEVFFGNSGSE